VQSVSVSANRAGAGVAVEDRKPDRSFDAYARQVDIGSRFFETLGIQILSGRALDQRDGAGGVRSVVVNEAFSRHFFPDGANPLGKIFRDAKQNPYQIVGVCADWRADQFRDPVHPSFYGSLLQDPHAGTVDFELKFAGREAETVRQIRETARSIDPSLALFDIRTEMEQVENALSQERLLASLGGVFGALALLLASIGVYGVMAYAVARRTGEIGIRMALGARPGRVAWIVLRETLLLAALGVILGIPLVIGAAPVLDHFLAPGWQKTFAYGVKPNDPALIGFAAFVLAAVAFCAGYLPARRAASIDPMNALRHQ
jgi:predicted permease